MPALQQAEAPGPESPAGMRSDITDRVPPCGRAIPRRLPLTTYIRCSGAARAQCINRTRKSDRSHSEQKTKAKFSFFTYRNTGEGHATLKGRMPKEGRPIAFVSQRTPR